MEHGDTENIDMPSLSVNTQGSEDSDTRTIVGHLPRELNKSFLWYFLLHGGTIDCEVTGRRQCSPIVQGGLEISCSETLCSKNQLVAKAELLHKNTQLSNR